MQVPATKPSSIVPQAYDGFRDASSYDAHRPSYPPSAVSSLLDHLGVAGRTGARIVEIGAGTGKFTELLLAAGREEAFDIVAVEPHEEMREQLRRKNLDAVGGGKLKIVDGDAVRMGVDDGWADACIAAQVSGLVIFVSREIWHDVLMPPLPRRFIGILISQEYRMGSVCYANRGLGSRQRKRYGKSIAPYVLEGLWG
jgi:SAM-dependent methyltransferase